MSFSSFFLRYSPVQRFKIRDHSMEPCLKDGDNVIVLCSKKVKNCDIVVFKRGRKFFIKRVTRKTNNKVFVEGDNKNDSYDSNRFGFIDKNVIIGKVIKKL